MTRILKKPRVKEDLIEHFAFIARDKIDPAHWFLKVAEETFQRISVMPRMGRAPSRRRMSEVSDAGLSRLDTTFPFSA